MAKNKQMVEVMKSKNLLFHKEAARVWSIAIKKGDRIGTLRFTSSPLKYTVIAEITYDSAEYETTYQQEVFGMMAEMGLVEPQIHFVEYKIAGCDQSIVSMLEKLGYQKEVKAEYADYLVKEQGHTSWISVYLCMGVGVGVAMGNSSGNMGMGMCLGMCCGMLFGVALDSSAKKKRDEIAQERNKS